MHDTSVQGHRHFLVGFLSVCRLFFGHIFSCLADKGFVAHDGRNAALIKKKLYFEALQDCLCERYHSHTAFEDPLDKDIGKNYL